MGPDDILINADSRQIYQKLDIGTAKPLPSELARYDYRLINTCPPTERYNAYQFTLDVKKIFEEAHSLPGKQIWIVGGTPFYLSSLLDGLFEAESISPEIQSQVKAWENVEGTKGLFERVQKLDPEYALEVDSKNPRRLARALEAMLSSGEKFSSLRTRRAPTFNAEYLIVALFRPRQELYERINARVDEMMKLGFLEEVKGLLASGIKLEDPGMTSIGYRELGLHLEGKFSLAGAVEEIKQNTRHFAKRQINFLKHLNGVLWVSEPLEKVLPDAELDAWLTHLPVWDSQVSLSVGPPQTSSRLEVTQDQLKELLKRFYGN